MSRSRAILNTALKQLVAARTRYAGRSSASGAERRTRRIILTFARIRADRLESYGEKILSRMMKDLKNASMDMRFEETIISVNETDSWSGVCCCEIEGPRTSVLQERDLRIVLDLWTFLHVQMTFQPKCANRHESACANKTRRDNVGIRRRFQSREREQRGCAAE